MITLPFLLNLSGTELLLIFWFYFIFGAIAFFGCLLNKRISSATKGIWILAICLIPVFGPLAYLIGGREDPS